MCGWRTECYGGINSLSTKVENFIETGKQYESNRTKLCPHMTSWGLFLNGTMLANLIMLKVINKSDPRIKVCCKKNRFLKPNLRKSSSIML